MFQGDLVSELHIEDMATPGFKKFWKKWMSVPGMPGEGPYYVQFTKPRSADDKRMVGSVSANKDPYAEPPEIGVHTADVEDFKKKRAQQDRALNHLKKLKIEDPTIYRIPNHNDPIGLYAYPLEYVINHPMDIKYGNNMEFLRVVKIRDEAKALKLQEVKPFQLAQYAKAMGWGDFDGSAILAALKSTMSKRQGNQNAHALWFMIQHEGRIYAVRPRPKLNPDEAAKLEDEDDDGEAKPGGEVKWWPFPSDPHSGKNTRAYEANNVLSQIEQTKRIRKAGWDVLIDIDETGTKAVIYHGEPEQALIINRNAFDVVDTYDLRQFRQTGYGTDYIKGITRDVSKMRKRMPTEIAHKIAAGIGDKVEKVVPVKDDQHNELDGSLADAVRYMSGENPLTIARDSGKNIVTPTYYQTKRGFISVGVDTGAESTDNSHRSKGWNDHSSLDVSYVDERGLSHFSGHDITVKNLISRILNKHPQVPLRLKEKLTAKSIFAAQLAVGTVKVQMEQLQDGDFDFTSFALATNRFAGVLDLPTVPIEDSSDEIGLYALVSGMVEHLLPDNLYVNLGLDNLTLDEDEHFCEQAPDIARLKEKSEAWFKTMPSDIINPDAAKSLIGRGVDWIYAYNAPGIYLRLHPEAKPIIEIMQWLYIVEGENAGVLRSKRGKDATSTMEEAARTAHNMPRPLRLACNPKNIGDEAKTLPKPLPLKDRQNLGDAIDNLAGILGGLGHKLFKVSGDDAKAKTINRLRDKLADDGFTIMRVLKKKEGGHNPTNINLDNAIKIMDSATKDLFQIMHLEDHPTVPANAGLMPDEMESFQQALGLVYQQFDTSLVHRPEDKAVIGRLTMLSMSQRSIHNYRHSSMGELFGQEAKDRWIGKYAKDHAAILSDEPPF